jgi:hypothetical protein
VGDDRACGGHRTAVLRLCGERGGVDRPEPALHSARRLHLATPGNLPDGGSRAFGSVPDTRVNVRARVEPVNRFSFGSLTGRKKRGIALIQVNLPNPGRLSVSGSGVTDFVRGSSRITAPGTVTVALGATRSKQRKLKRRGKVFVTPTFRYTPTSGSRHSETLVVKLKKKGKKKHR